MDNNLLDIHNIPWKVDMYRRILVPDKIIIMTDREPDEYYDPSYKVLVMVYSAHSSRMYVRDYQGFKKLNRMPKLRYPFKGMYNLEII